MYTIDCSTICRLPKLIFDFNKRIELRGEEYVIESDGECHLNVAEGNFKIDGKLVYFAGDPFLAAYYTKYDMDKNEISFAKSINKRKCD